MEIIEKNEDISLLDNTMTHIIFSGKEYFSNLTLCKVNIFTILGLVKIIEGSGNATIILPNCTTLHLEDALLNNKSKRNLLNFQDVRHNKYHLKTLKEDNIGYLYIISYKMSIKTIHEKFETSNSGLYCVLIQAIESYATMS